ncbi:hypothetical protein TorRG33x02_028900 [Trema orientale]|uniref:Uncharacterized protein n=1 Tax=Trema orientale TaxID=63057 RepID=A0A2P5FTL9_TREOI|nr:hypothetical protein TorRG33x02_028900 [Trema orientale]
MISSSSTSSSFTAIKWEAVRQRQITTEIATNMIFEPSNHVKIETFVSLRFRLLSASLIGRKVKTNAAETAQGSQANWKMRFT